MNKNYQNQKQMPVSDYNAEQQMQPVADNDVPAEGVAGNPYSRLEEWLQDFFGESFKLDSPESQEKLKSFFRSNVEQNERLASVLELDPRLAQLLSDVVQGKRSAHAAMARYYGKSFLDHEEGSPEYEEMLRMDEERRNEAYEMANNRREYEANLERSRPVIENFCRENGYEPAEFMDRVWEQLVFPILSGTYTQEVCQALEHAINYEQDVEDAFAAGNIKGRNTNIRRMQEEFGDGLPKGMSSVAPAQEERRPKGNSLIDAALKA
ncbi:MAG: hypothetical protein IIV19_05975 [Bacteroidaceae bacterium]|nr:hypothetical protein [Bacteroidaceae bacterium]